MPEGGRMQIPRFKKRPASGAARSLGTNENLYEVNENLYEKDLHGD
jgi:hypothetical protein